ncbi:MAG: hypothetical protein V1692_01145 [bacterium]
MSNTDIKKIDVTDFYEERTCSGKLGDKTIKVIIKPMTKEQAREVFPYRKKRSFKNAEYSESRFGGGNNLADDIALLLGGNSVRCEMCIAPTLKTYLKNGTCPDCDGRSQYNGTDPHQ